MDEDSFELYGSEQLYGSSQEDFENQLQMEHQAAQVDQSSQLQLQPNSHIQPQSKKQLQKETSSQLLQLNQQNAVCKICYKYALDGVLCRNQKCSILFCATCANKHAKKNTNKCPFCRTGPFQTLPSPLRSAINKIQLACQFCQGRYPIKQELQHYKKCQYFLKAQCDYCEERVLPEHLAKHVRLMHEDKLGQIIERYCSTPRASLDPRELVEKNRLYFSKINRTPHLGTTGKFYCGERLEGPKCTCCNGFCGPTNGENCVECMKLDMKRLGLKKGYLVNSKGHVCWREGEDFVCGVMNHQQSGSCRVGAPCRACKNMRTNVKRYSDLL